VYAYSSAAEAYTFVSLCTGDIFNSLDEALLTADDFLLVDTYLKGPLAQLDGFYDPVSGGIVEIEYISNLCPFMPVFVSLNQFGKHDGLSVFPYDLHESLSLNEPSLLVPVETPTFDTLFETYSQISLADAPTLTELEIFV